MRIITFNQLNVITITIINTVFLNISKESVKNK